MSLFPFASLYEIEAVRRYITPHHKALLQKLPFLWLYGCRVFRSVPLTVSRGISLNFEGFRDGKFETAFIWLPIRCREQCRGRKGDLPDSHWMPSRFK